MPAASFKKNQIQADFNRLQKRLQRLGLFQVSTARISFDITIHFVLFITSYALQNSHPLISFLIATIAAINLVWWIHDSGHDAFFSNRKTSKFWIETLGLLFLGMPQIEYHYGIHRRHHGSTNILGKDTALETGPIIWHPLMAERGPENLRRFQTFVWIFLILPLTYPLITYRCLQLGIQKRDYLAPILLIVRFAVWLLVFQLSFWALIGPVLIAGFVLGFAASLNHFAMPIAKRVIQPFPAQVFCVTQNIDAHSKFATWLTGGLNYHIEHHLFPKMPSRNYSKVSSVVRRFANQHGLPYHKKPTIESISQLVETLQNPLRQEILEEKKA